MEALIKNDNLLGFDDFQITFSVFNETCRYFKDFLLGEVDFSKEK
jgi:hypothetical protein